MSILNSTQAREPVLQVVDLCKSFTLQSDTTIEVLKGIRFEVMPSELVAITGRSGSGKSTLLHLLGTLDSPTSGKVLVNGVCPHDLNDKKMSEFRNKSLGFVFQQNNLLPEFSATENVMLPSLIREESPAKARHRACELLELVGLAHRLEHYPGQLSGGEQQRIAVARALINHPLLLLADEPSGNLDSQNALNVHNLFKEINRTQGTTILIVTHNEAFANELPRRITLLDGSIQSDVRAHF